MGKNSKATSPRVSHLAAETLQDPRASAIAKRLAASALSQADGAKQTSTEMAELAGKVLRSDKYAADTLELAASVVAQANPRRGG